MQDKLLLETKNGNEKTIIKNIEQNCQNKYYSGYHKGKSKEDNRGKQGLRNTKSMNEKT